MKILVTGIGITGKSTFRRLLVKMFRKLGLKVEHFDADLFDEIRDPAEIDCLKNLPSVFQPGMVYIIEDIHATEKDAVLPLTEYNSIYYLKTSSVTQVLFWLTRMWRWFQCGNFSWEAKTKWEGTGKSYDIQNILPIFRKLIRDLKNRKKWVEEDLQKISSLHYQIIKPFWTPKGPQFDKTTLRIIKKMPLS